MYRPAATTAKRSNGKRHKYGFRLGKGGLVEWRWSCHLGASSPLFACDRLGCALMVVHPESAAHHKERVKL